MSQWQTLLHTYQATLSEQGDEVITVAEHDSQTCIVPLVHNKAISILGPEAEKFLQGQLSCDMKDVSDLGSRLGAHCNIKGGMLALYRVISTEGGFWLRTHQDMLEGGLKTLKSTSCSLRLKPKIKARASLDLGL
ncbi:hypothetical protein [Neptunomonas japonica]|uniref:hypothetical protein n=1 Tax=Neptunomonas japonica TaxID=417574 RepID=UPI001F3591DF|nr:hypothetical protein [Neptunomonas japonica]